MEEETLRNLIHELILADLDNTYHERIKPIEKKIPQRKIKKLDKLIEKELIPIRDSIVRKMLEKNSILHKNKHHVKNSEKLQIDHRVLVSPDL